MGQSDCTAFVSALGVLAFVSLSRTGLYLDVQLNPKRSEIPDLDVLRIKNVEEDKEEEKKERRKKRKEKERKMP